MARNMQLNPRSCVKFALFFRGVAAQPIDLEFRNLYESVWQTMARTYSSIFDAGLSACVKYPLFFRGVAAHMIDLNKAWEAIVRDKPLNPRSWSTCMYTVFLLDLAVQSIDFDFLSLFRRREGYST